MQSVKRLISIRLSCVVVFGIFTQSTFAHTEPTPAGSGLNAERGCVILIHGLAGSRWNWVGMRQLLQRNGYHVINLSYASRQQTIERSAQSIIPAVDECKQKQRHPVHLVGHSMGGLLIRYYLQQHGDVGVGRVVMLGTPNQGSELSDPEVSVLPHERAVAGWLGPAVPQLSTRPDGFIARLSEPSVPTGIIAGYLTPVPWLNRRFNTANDGLVAVYSTRLSQPHDFVMLPSIHSSLALQVDAQRQTLWFLKTGRFYRASEKPV